VFGSARPEFQPVSVAQEKPEIIPTSVLPVRPETLAETTENPKLLHYIGLYHMVLCFRIFLLFIIEAIKFRFPECFDDRILLLCPAPKRGHQAMILSDV